MPRLRDVAEAVRFFTRLPVPGGEAAPVFDEFAWAAPIAGAIVGAIGAGALSVAHALGLPPLLSAPLATGALVLASGALHEDGLADLADGFGGGGSRDKKLAIMRDSRIGVFGTVALNLALFARIGALAGALGDGLVFAAGALIVAASVSRAAALAPLAFLDAARTDGAGAAAGRLQLPNFLSAWASAIALALAFGMAATGIGRAIVALAASALAAAGVVVLAKRQIGGQTGDVAGTAQQAAEVAAWVGLLVGAAAH